MLNRNLLGALLAAMTLLTALVAAPAAVAVDCDPTRQNCGDNEPPPPPPPNDPPSVSITGGPTGAQTLRKPSFSFTASDPEGKALTIQCRFKDTDAYSACSSPVQPPSNLADGSYTFSVRASDSANTTTKTRSFSVDTTGPVVRADAGWPDLARIGRYSVAFNTNETDLDHYECALPTESFVTCPASWQIPERAGQGVNHVLVRGVDKLGNVGPQVASVRWWLDTIGPETQILDGPPAFTNDNTPSFRVGAPRGDEEYGPTWDCGIFTLDYPYEDNLSWCSGSGQWETTQGYGFPKPDGEYRFVVQGIDAVGNRGTYATRTFVIDTKAPTVAFAASSPAGKLAFAADEEHVTFTCSIDGAAATPCSASVDVSALAPGTHVVAVRGTDRAGNVSAAAERSVVVQAPVEEKPAEQKPGGSGDTSKPAPGTSTTTQTSSTPSPAGRPVPTPVAAPRQAAESAAVKKAPAVKKKTCFATKKVKGKKRKVKVPCRKAPAKKRAAKKRR
jgi:large repetitive protein